MLVVFGQKAVYTQGLSLIYRRNSTEMNDDSYYSHSFGHFRVASWPNLHVFVMWEKAGPLAG